MRAFSRGAHYMQMRIGVTVVAFLLVTSAFAHPSVSVVIDSRGNVYYSDLAQVWRIAPDGKQSVAVPNVHTHELALDPQDNLYGEHLWYEGEKVDKWGWYVWRRAPDGRVTMVLPRREGFRTNYGFVRDRAGNMYFAEGKEVRKRPASGAIGVVAKGFTDLRWMHATPGGTLYLIDSRDLVRIRDGRVTRVVKNLADTTLTRPHVALRHAIMGLWTDGAENVYAADYAHGEVKRIAPDGRVTTFVKSTLPWSPTGGAFTKDGTLWLLEWW